MAEATAVTTLGEVFKGNTEITSFDELQYFTSLTSLDSEAFSACSALSSIVIPENMSSIGSQAFKGCSGLEQIQCYALEVPDVVQNTFEQVNVRSVLLLVPDEAEANYRAHPVWSQFWVETPTDISLVPTSKREEPVYDLSGRRQNALRRGLNIVGGKTILLRK